MKFCDTPILKVKIPQIPSYSMIHAPKDIFSIVMYSGSYCVKLKPGLSLYYCDAVRIVLLPWIAIILYKPLYHSGRKSRNTAYPQVNIIFFPLYDQI